MKMLLAVIGLYFTGIAAGNCYDRLVVQVSPVGAKLELKRSFFGNTWRDLNVVAPLHFDAGLVDAMQPGALVCNASNVAVITLKGASWDTPVGKTGTATCDGCDNTTPQNQKWKVIEAE